MLDYLKNNILFIIIISFLVLILFGEGYLVYNSFLGCDSYQEVVDTSNNVIEETKENISDEQITVTNVMVDIKGAVKKPGVYEVSYGSIVNDVVSLAGGFKWNAYTNNINLSKVVTNEMVIYVYTKYEHKNLNNKSSDNNYEVCKSSTYNIDNCISNGGSMIENGDSDTSFSDDSEKTKLVNINTASKEELLSLSGVGESKAIGIIKYRTEHGAFKSIEEILNVSGIGNSIYEKIKDNITV